MRLFELFAGYGGASFALKKAGIEHEVAGYSEIDKFAIQCYEQNHKGKNLGDISKININELPDFDLLTGGFPCQDVSIAGKRDLSKGRTNLYLEILRIAEAKKPKYMLLENVKGLLSMGKKKNSADQSLLMDKIIRDLKRIGYGVCWKVLNSKEYGIPQNRERVWFVCKLGGWGFMEFQFPQKEELKIFIKDILKSDVPEKYYLSDKLQERFSKYIEEKDSKICAMRGRNPDNPTSRVSGLPTEQMIEFQEEPISNTITSVQKDNLVYDRKGFDSREKGFRESKLSPTLSTKMGTGGNNVPMVANCLDANMHKGIDPVGFYEKSKRNVVMNTITQPIGRYGHSREELKYINNVGKLRRLTPIECFRLMGFVNDEINLHGLSDTQCYKMAGNGWDINIVSKIFKEMFK